MENTRKRSLIVSRRINGELSYYAGNNKWTKRMHRAKRHKDMPTYDWLTYMSHKVIEI